MHVINYFYFRSRSRSPGYRRSERKYRRRSPSSQSRSRTRSRSRSISSRGKKKRLVYKNEWPNCISFLWWKMVGAINKAKNTTETLNIVDIVHRHIQRMDHQVTRMGKFCIGSLQWNKSTCLENDIHGAQVPKITKWLHQMVIQMIITLSKNFCKTIESKIDFIHFRIETNGDN